MLFPQRSQAQLGILLQALQIPVIRQLLPRLEFELRRARRYEHPLAVLVLGSDDAEHPRNGAAEAHSGDQSGIPSIARTMEEGPVRYLLLGSFLRNNLRETDLLASAPESSVYMAFLPETDRQGAQRALRRLNRCLSESGVTRLTAGIAEFPNDAFTVGDLFERASRAYRTGEERADATLDAETSNG